MILGRSRFMLRESESELLATIGVFRAIPLRDLQCSAENATPIARSSLDADVRSLREQGLLQRHSLVMNGRHETIAVLTRTGRDLLDHARPSHLRPPTSHLRPPTSDLRPPTSHLRPPTSDLRRQRFYAGVVKPRELAHDAQLYRMFDIERERLSEERATVMRVVLDDELKGDYHRYVHQQHLAGANAIDARRAFADDYQLSFAGQRIHFPDIRVEYESDEGRIEYRDLELATEHYSRSQLSGKVAAGFRVYRAAGAGARRGGMASDPHHLEWIG